MNTTEIRKIELKTSDALMIAAREFIASAPQSNRCLVVIPGFAQHSGTKTFTRLCTELATTGPVLCLDPRGTGSSEGRYGFGLREYLDVAAAVQWARERFARVDALGFSLGAYSSLRAACETDVAPDQLFLASVPTSVNRIVWEGPALRHALETLTHPSQLGKERDLGFRWGNPLLGKPSADVFASKARIPLHFLVGTADLLVPPAMSRAVFNAALAPKTWTVFEQGRHAELLYFSNPSGFGDWLSQTATAP